MRLSNVKVVRTRDELKEQIGEAVERPAERPPVLLLLDLPLNPSFLTARPSATAPGPRSS
jgi:hypothetical protein